MCAFVQASEEQVTSRHHPETISIENAPVFIRSFACLSCLFNFALILIRVMPAPYVFWVTLMLMLIIYDSV